MYSTHFIFYYFLFFISQIMSSDGYDGTVEVLGWSCFTAVPSNVANEAVRTLPEATMAKEELKTTGEE